MWQRPRRLQPQRSPHVPERVAGRKAVQEPFRCVSRKSANSESFPAAVRSAFDECVRTAGTTSSFRYATSSAVSFSRVSAIFATERLKRTEASSTLRSNSVIHILPVRVNVHACVAVAKLHYYRGPSASGQSTLCGGRGYASEIIPGQRAASEGENCCRGLPISFRSSTQESKCRNHYL